MAQQVANKKVTCSQCLTPVAETTQAGVLIIRVKHFGEMHETHLVIASIDKNRVLVVM